MFSLLCLFLSFDQALVLKNTLTELTTRSLKFSSKYSEDILGHQLEHPVVIAVGPVGKYKSVLHPELYGCSTAVSV